MIIINAIIRKTQFLRYYSNYSAPEANRVKNRTFNSKENDFVPFRLQIQPHPLAWEFLWKPYEP